MSTAAAKTPPAPREREGANTYRAYIMNLADPLAPTIQLAYVQGAKYGPAWKAARRLVATGQPHEEVPNTKTFFADEACTQVLDVGFGDRVICAHVMDLKDPTPKLDPAKLSAIINDESISPEKRLEALQALTGMPTAKAAA